MQTCTSDHPNTPPHIPPASLFEADFKAVLHFSHSRFFSVFPSFCLAMPLYMFISLTFHTFIFLALSSVGSIILARCGDHRAGVYRFGCGFGLFVPAQCHHNPVQPRIGYYGLHPPCTLSLQSYGACPPQRWIASLPVSML